MESKDQQAPDGGAFITFPATLFTSFYCVDDEQEDRSVLGPLLLIIFINDLDIGVTSRLCKFADDTKLGGKVDRREGGNLIQKSPVTLIGWANDWRIQFNLSKCKVLGLSKNHENGII